MTNKKEKTQKADEPKTTDMITNLDITAMIGGQTIETKPIKGKTVSLNLKMETFFGVGSIWLSPKKTSCIIPNDLTMSQEALIRKALAAGVLVEGDVKIPPIDKDKSVLEEYWQSIRLYGLEPANPNSKSMIKFQALYKKGVDRNWTAKEIASYCMEKERGYKNRELVLKLMQDILKYCICPDTLLES